MGRICVLFVMIFFTTCVRACRACVRACMRVCVRVLLQCKCLSLRLQLKTRFVKLYLQGLNSENAIFVFPGAYCHLDQNVHSRL